MTRTLPMLVALFVTLIVPTEGRAACTAALPPDHLPALLDDAEAAWISLDVDRFGAAVDRSAAELPCLSGPPDRASLARFDRLVGMRAFLARDTPRARLAFAASRRVDPGSELPLALVPEANPLRGEFSAVPLDAITYVPVTVRRGATPWFDAEPTALRPANVPTLFQLRGADDAVRVTAWLWPDDPLPAAALPDRRRRNLLVVAAVQEVAAAGLYAGSVAAARTYWADDTARDRLDGLRTAANVLNGAALGVVATGAGTAVVAFVLPERR